MPVTREPYDLVMAAETVEDPVLARIEPGDTVEVTLEPR
jgi:hypothetical protein